jgi:basic membrane protein A
MRTRLFLLALVVVGGIATAAGMGHTQSPEPARTLKIAILLGPSGRGDSFTDAALAGLEAAKQRGALTVVERLPTRPEDYGPTVDALAAEKPDLIIGVGFLYAEPFRVATASHPETRFLLLDAELPSAPNLRSVTFRGDEGSFLAGVAAAAESKRNAVGFIGGMNMPTIQGFECGYEGGIRWAAKELNRVVRGTSVYIGATPEAFSRPAEAAELSRTMVARQGVDVLFAAAGASGIGVIETARALNVKAIGVDVDQSSLAPAIVITSMRKRLDRAVEQAIADVRARSFRGGAVVMSLANAGVDLVLPGLLTPATQKLIAKAREGIVRGRITPCGAAQPPAPTWKKRPGN